MNIGKLSKRLYKEQDGYMVVLGIGIIVFMLAVTTLAIDIGWYAYHINKAQQAAELAALAGAQHLPLDRDKAEEVMAEVFEKNYGKPLDIRRDVSITFGNKRIQIDYNDGVETLLFWIPLFRYGDPIFPIRVQIEVKVEPLAQPEEMIPLAFHNNKLLGQIKYGERYIPYDEEQELVGMNVFDTASTFTVIDPSNGGLTSNTELTDWIVNGYPDDAPTYGRNVRPRHDMSAAAVLAGLQRRMNSGDAIVYCPVVNFGLSSTRPSQVQILGYVRLQLISVTTVVENGKEYVKLEATFTEHIEQRGLSEPVGKYYGTKVIYVTS